MFIPECNKKQFCDEYYLIETLNNLSNILASSIFKFAIIGLSEHKTGTNKRTNNIHMNTTFLVK